MDREKQLISEYILRGLNFNAVNLVGLQKKTKGGAPFLVLEFKGKIRILYCCVVQFIAVCLRQHCRVNY
jgi:hypothetical protein